MHGWGLLLGSVYPLLFGAGLWPLRRHLAGGRRTSLWSLTVVCVTFFLLVLLTVLGGSLGPPYDIIILAPATVVAAITTPRRGAMRAILIAIAASYIAAIAVGSIPGQAGDDIGSFRIFGVLGYAVPGALWATLGGAVLMSTREHAA